MTWLTFNNGKLDSPDRGSYQSFFFFFFFNFIALARAPYMRRAGWYTAKTLYREYASPALVMMVQNSEHDNQRSEMSLSDNTHKMLG